MGFKGWAYWIEQLLAGNRRHGAQLLLILGALLAFALLVIAAGAFA